MDLLTDFLGENELCSKSGRISNGMWFKMYSGSIWLQFGMRLLAKQLKYAQKDQNGPESD